MTIARWTFSVRRWTLNSVYGRNRCQTTRPNFARTRLGLFQRSPEVFSQSSGWRGDFTEGRQGSFDGERHLHSKSQIVARRFSRRRQDLDFDFFRRRITHASEYRDRRNVDAKLRRVVWSESDGLPGVIIDRYGDHFVLQTLTCAMDIRKDSITAAMVDLFGDRVIIERNDAPVRNAEGLELRRGVLRGTPSEIAIEIEGVKLEVDLLQGQKTGFYLDQRHNYGIVAGYARDRRVLDCFANQGAFALTCARTGAADVTAVEENSANIATAKRNAARNELKTRWIEQDVFQFLRAAE